MEQMKTDGLAIIPFNYEDENLPAYFRNFRPIVFRTENGVCCLLGPDPESGILGAGETKEQAISSWLVNFEQRIKRPNENDKIATEILDSLSMSKDDVW